MQIFCDNNTNSKLALYMSITQDELNHNLEIKEIKNLFNYKHDNIINILDYFEDRIETYCAIQYTTSTLY